MSAIERQTPAGTVAVTFSSDSGRYSSLFSRLNDLEIPEGTVKTFWWGQRHTALNDLVTDFLKSNSYWVWIISEDHGFEPNVLMNLLSRSEAMVAPIVVDNYAPFFPKAWTDLAADGTETRLHLNDVTGPTLMKEVRGANVTGMLVRRAVFEAMQPPWFRMSEEVSEDLYFCERAKELGFQIYVDTATRLSTMSVSSVIPTHQGDKWELGVDVGEDINFSLPIKHR